MCYCNGPIDELGVEAMQQCVQCSQWYHFNHLKSPTRPKLWLLSDHFWNFICSKCTPGGVEKMERLSLSWVQLVQLILYNFIKHQTLQQKYSHHPYINNELNTASKSNNVKGDHIYFRWKEDICRIIDSYWNEVCPDRQRSPTWNNTVASALSTNSKIFLSGTVIFEIGGWWSLHTVAPPDASNQSIKKAIVRSKKVAPSPRKQTPTRPSRATPTATPTKKGSSSKNIFAKMQGDGLSTDSDDMSSLSSLSDIENQTPPKLPSKRPSSSMKTPHGKIPSTSHTQTNYESDTSSLTSSDNEAPKIAQTPKKSLSRKFTSSPSPLSGSPSPKRVDTLLNSDFSPPRRALDQAVSQLFKSIEKRNKNIDFKSNNSTDSTITLPMIKETKAKSVGSVGGLEGDSYEMEEMPKKVYKFCENDSDPETGANLLITKENESDEEAQSDEELEFMDAQKEWETMMKLSHSSYPLPTAANQMLRRLQVRRIHRQMNKQLLDIDDRVNDYLYNLPTELSQCPSPSSQCTTEIFDQIGDESNRERELSAYELQQKLKHYKIEATPYKNSFASRIYGNLSYLNPNIYHNLNSSVYNLNQPLKPLLRREFHYTKIPPRMQLLQSIELFGKSMDELNSLDPNVYTHSVPIDFCYFQLGHLDQVNELLCRSFWPGINISDALDFPEFTVIALYKKLVIGCAFMTPEGYITYIAVSEGWKGIGIGKFMLYHLIQTAGKGQDITLHVSANNPAMIMYQKFGFKPEQFLINFYDKYLPQDSKLCKNSLLIRLRQK